jgi:hypothetical protein
LARILATLDSRRATPSPSYGYGLLDAYRAVTASVPADAPNPVYDLATPFMKRAVRLGHGAGRAPKPVALRAAPLGTYAVGSRSRVTMQVLVGIVLAAIGLLLLVALGAVGLRGRGRRRPPDQQTVFVPYEPIPSVDQPSGRPHPRPRPGPGPSSGPETRFHT